MPAEYTILNPNFFIKHMELIASYMDEGIIRFSDEIRLVGMDPSRIAVLELKMGEDLIETNNKKKLEAPINLDDFSKIMKRFSNPSKLLLICDEMDNKIIVKGKIKNKTKTFKLSMIDIDNSDFKDPIPNLTKIQYNSVFTIPAGDLSDAIKDTEIFCECFVIETKEGKLYISGSGITGRCDIEIELETELYSDEKSSYRSSLVNNILKFIKGSNVLIMFNSDFPIAIYDKLSSKSHMLYFLAPRVVEDKEDDW